MTSGTAARKILTAQPKRAAPSQRPREADLIAQWGAGVWLGWSLHATDGARYTVVFQGRPGGSVGPDFRDAVLLDAMGARVTGDIELHLQPSGWRAHGHSIDPRYNGLALHVTLTGGRDETPAASRLASGRAVPLVVLASQRAPGAKRSPAPAWPCHAGAGGHAALRREALHTLGWQRFEQFVATFTTLLRASAGEEDAAHRGWRAVDSALVVALAEGLGYGRDRLALRACGERLAAGASSEALLTTIARSGHLERRRVSGLLALMERWGEGRPFLALTDALERGAARAGAAGAARALTEALLVKECGAISVGRARILAFNVVLPCVAAWADTLPATSPEYHLSSLARAATAALPSLPSNQITREMCRQLGMPHAPRGALAQQGLHHLWAQWCRTKQCDGCPCAHASG